MYSSATRTTEREFYNPMKALILAAGYGTRLKPYTDHTAKPLLPIAGRPLIDHCIDWIVAADAVDEILVITNQRYWQGFQEWQEATSFPLPVTLINDGTTTNENRLGAIRDIELAIEDQRVTDDLLILGGDNIFTFELAALLRFYHEKKTPVIAAHALSDVEKLKRTGVVLLDEEARVIDFEEKPSEPKSNLAAPPLYIYPQHSLGRFKEYLANPVNPDAPGHFVAWLHQQEAVHAFPFEGDRYAIDDPETYRWVDEAVRGLAKS